MIFIYINTHSKFKVFRFLVEMPKKRHGEKQSPPIFSHEWVIQNHGDIGNGFYWYYFYICDELLKSKKSRKFLRPSQITGNFEQTKKMSHGILIILLREILPKIFRFSDIRVNLLFFGLSFKRLLGFWSFFNNFLAVAFNKNRIKLPVWPCFSCLVWCSNSPKTRPIFSSPCTIPLINQK